MSGYVIKNLTTRKLCLGGRVFGTRQEATCYLGDALFQASNTPHGNVLDVVPADEAAQLTTETQVPRTWFMYP